MLLSCWLISLAGSPTKHFESRFTKFYEGYWLPTRFGYDTRKVQYSSLILTGQMTREEALEKLSKPAYDEEMIKHDFEYVATKLGISADELQSIWIYQKTHIKTINHRNPSTTSEQNLNARY